MYWKGSLSVDCDVDIRVVGNMENRTAMMFNDDFNPVSAALMCQNNVMLMPNSV